jgi:type I restriction enzyme S subunit
MATLGDYVTLQRGNTYKSGLLGQPGPVLLGLGSIQRNGGFKADKLETYGGESDPRILLQPGDIYVSLKDVTQSADLLGAVAQVPSYVKVGRLTQDTVKLVFKSNDVCPNYIYWLLRTPQYRAYCKAHATGTTNLGLPREDFLSFEIPDLTPERSFLLQTLVLLEEKIELNRRMNETLEAMAQAIFRDWFVDFGPTRRKLAGITDPVEIMGGLVQDAARAAELAALFPEVLADNGLPEGWEEKSLDQIATFLNGLALQKFPATDEHNSLPVIKIAELRNGLGERTGRADRNIPSKYIVRDGDFLFSWSGSLMAKFWTGGEGALNQHLFKVFSEDYPRWFYSAWVHYHMPEFQAIAASKATTMGHIQRSHLSSAKVVCPPSRVLNFMSCIMEPLVDLCISRQLENRSLAATRDLLLPKLMSGEIRLREAQEIAEAVP